MNSRLVKQNDGYSISGPVSAVFSDILMSEMEEDVVVPTKPSFYKRYVDDTYIRRKKNGSNELFRNLNSYHKTLN